LKRKTELIILMKAVERVLEKELERVEKQIERTAKKAERLKEHCFEKDDAEEKK